MLLVRGKPPRFFAGLFSFLPLLKHASFRAAGVPRQAVTREAVAWIYLLELWFKFLVRGKKEQPDRYVITRLLQLA